MHPKYPKIPQLNFTVRDQDVDDRIQRHLNYLLGNDLLQIQFLGNFPNNIFLGHESVLRRQEKVFRGLDPKRTMQV